MNIDTNSPQFNNATPLAQHINKKHARYRFPDIFLLFSFTLLIFSIGFWIQSAMLQPSTNAEPKIIDYTPTPSQSITKEPSATNSAQ